MRALRLTEVLAGMLDWDRRARLDTLAPEILTTPAGSRRRLDYLAGPEPVLPVPVQELFGTRETPSLCAGRVPVMQHLLSPAGRPVQITRDLAGGLDHNSAHLVQSRRRRSLSEHGFARANPYGPAGLGRICDQGLAGFWARGYPQIRKKLRGRYSKHPWPEDPYSAVPVTRVRPQRG